MRSRAIGSGSFSVWASSSDAAEGAAAGVQLTESVIVGIVNDDMAELRDGLHEVLEGVVPVRCGLEEVHDAAVREAELQVAGLADVLGQFLGLVQFGRIVVRVVVAADLLHQRRHVLRLEHDLAHGDEGRVGGLGVLDEVFPAIVAVGLEDDGGDVLRDVPVHAPHAVPGDERDHVILHCCQIIENHRRTIFADYAAVCCADQGVCGDRLTTRISRANLWLPMIFSKDYIGYLARQTTKHLIAAKMIKTDKPEMMNQRVAAALVDELALEDRINEEVRVILEAFQEDMHKSGASYPEMFKKVKMELARKYKAVL